MPRIGIIGGGMAGAAAAARLSRAGIDVVLFEAEPQLGGRVRQTVLGPTDHERRLVDLGPSWLHETLANPLFDLACAKGIELAYGDAETRYYLPGNQGGALPMSERAEPITHELESAIALAYHSGEEDQAPAMVSLRDFVQQFLHDRPLLTERQKWLAGRMLQQNEHWTAQLWEDIPAAEAAHDELGRNALVLRGMTQVWDLVWTERVPERVEVRLETPVTKIVQGPAGVTLTTFPGDKEREVLDGVVCTMSLGALKGALAQNVFSPPLPHALRQSIITSDVAALGKAFLLFDHEWWETEPDNLVVLVNESLDSPTDTRPVTFVNSFHHFLPNYGPVLLALTGPPLTQQLERCHSPDEIYQLLLPALEAIRQNRTQPVPPPTHVQVSHWTVNPLFGGSYSARTIGQSYGEMVQPFIDGADKIRFAGEHTVWDGAGCVHGAYASGRRAADDVLEQLGIHPIQK